MVKIAVLTNKTKDKSFSIADKVVSYLAGKSEVYMPDDGMLLTDYGVRYLPYNEIFKVAEIAIVIGGDGTILRAAPDCAMSKIPALGINLGTVGFLTEVEVSDIENSLDKLLRGQYIKERRMLLKATINDGEECHVLNDIVVSKRDHQQLKHLDLFADGE